MSLYAIMQSFFSRAWRVIKLKAPRSALNTWVTFFLFAKMGMAVQISYFRLQKYDPLNIVAAILEVVDDGVGEALGTPRGGGGIVDKALPAADGLVVEARLVGVHVGHLEVHDDHVLGVVGTDEAVGGVDLVVVGSVPEAAVVRDEAGLGQDRVQVGVRRGDVGRVGVGVRLLPAADLDQLKDDGGDKAAEDEGQEDPELNSEVLPDHVVVVVVDVVIAARDGGVVVVENIVHPRPLVRNIAVLRKREGKS